MGDQEDNERWIQELHAPEVVKPIILSSPPPSPQIHASPSAIGHGTPKVTAKPLVPIQIAPHAEVAPPIPAQNITQPKSSASAMPARGGGNAPHPPSAKPEEAQKTSGKEWADPAWEVMVKFIAAMLGILGLILLASFWTHLYQSCRESEQSNPGSQPTAQTTPSTPLGSSNRSDQPTQQRVDATEQISPQQSGKAGSSPPTEQSPNASQVTPALSLDLDDLLDDTPSTPSSLGQLHISAYCVVSVGNRHSISREGRIKITGLDSSFNISTNMALPCHWWNIPSGDYAVSVAVPGYQEKNNEKLRVYPSVTNYVAAVLQPLPVSVRFSFPVTNVLFSVHNDTQRLGTSAIAYNLKPFVPHYLTFKAAGWRTKRVKVQFEEPGKLYDCAIDMEKVASRLIINVRARSGKSPTTGVLAINGGKSVQVSFPLELKNLQATGEQTLALSIDGYNVLDPSLKIVLFDKQTTDVTFIVERKR